jgi:hypothetical protein
MMLKNLKNSSKEPNTKEKMRECFMTADLINLPLLGLKESHFMDTIGSKSEVPKVEITTWHPDR